MTNLVTISVVSHRQIGLVVELFADIASHCTTGTVEVILTLNLPEELPFTESDYPFPIKVIRNHAPIGFAANHNQAFTHAAGRFFCVMNPDIRFNKDPFPALLACLKNSSAGVAAPIVMGASGEIEDSARRFPTPFKILGKAFGGGKGIDYVVKDKTIFPDWVGGMFMLFPSGVFREIGGFDTRYFLYYEDVDLCARLTLRGYRVALCHEAKVVHQPRRSSHRHFKFFKWHLASMVRFFCSKPFFKICWQRLTGQFP